MVRTITAISRPDDGKVVYKYTLQGWNGYGFAYAIPMKFLCGYVADFRYICAAEVPLSHL